jgi:hypothetical protein
VSSDRINPSSQSSFAALLRYFQRGDFACFSRVCELAFGPHVTTESYFCANLLFAAQACGLCEVSTETGVTKWWVAHQGDILIRSGNPKCIGVTPDWLAAADNSVLPLVTDSQMRPLVLGSRLPVARDSDVPQVFATGFDRLTPPFKDIEKQLCTEVTFTDDIVGQAEVYCPDVGRWDPVPLDALTGSQLVRIRREYSGPTYYAQHADLRIRFQITQPDWAFVAAYFLLPWRLSDVLRVEGATVSSHRAVRLPPLMSRLLFAAADSLRVGPIVRYESVDSNAIDGVRGYFEQAGVRQ